MHICTACWTAHADAVTRCPGCGATLPPVTSAENAEAIYRWRQRRRLRSHLLTGVILCFGLATLVGLPSSLLPGEIVGNLLAAVLFGVPLAFLVSRFADSVLGGACIGCGVGIAYAAGSMLLAGWPVTVGAVLLGIGIGILPGAIMGMHVGLDR